MHISSPDGPSREAELGSTPDSYREAPFFTLRHQVRS